MGENTLYNKIESDDDNEIQGGAVEELRRQLEDTKVNKGRPVSEDGGYATGGSRRSSTRSSRSSISSWRLSTPGSEDRSGTAGESQPGEQERAEHDATNATGGGGIGGTEFPQFRRQTTNNVTVAGSQNIQVGDRVEHVFGGNVTTCTHHHHHHHNYAQGATILHIHGNGACCAAEKDPGSNVGSILVKVYDTAQANVQSDEISRILEERIESSFRLSNCRVIVDPQPAWSFAIETTAERENGGAAALTNDETKLRQLVQELWGVYFGEGHKINVDIEYAKK